LVAAVVVAVMISGTLAQLGGPAWWSWMADLVPSERRARFWAFRHSFVSVASLIAVIASGFILDAFPDPRTPGGSFVGFAIVFTFAAFMGSADIILHLWVPEPKTEGRGGGSGVMSRILEPFKSRDFLWLTAAMGIWTFSIGLVGQFGLVYLREVYHVGYSAMAALMIAGTLGGSVAGILWGYVIDRVGARNFGAIMMMVAPLMGLFWFFIKDAVVTIPLPFFNNPVVYQPLLLLTVGGFFGGLFYSGVALSQISLLSALSPVKGRTMAMAVHWSVVGLLGATGPVSGGLVLDWVHSHPIKWIMPTGTLFGFFHILVLLQIGVVWLIAVRAMLQVRQREGEMSFRAALASLQFSNPLRVLPGIYNIYTMLASTSRGGRVDAVRRLGEDRMRIAVKDLICQLDDPSTDVREEATIALGRIGSADAVEALLAKFDDPNADIAPQIARALRHSHNRQAVDALIRRLADPDRETVAESVRALGEIGDDRAREPLLKVLEESGDAKLVSASSEALARLGEMAAVYEIFPRMNATHNPVLKRSLAVAAGDLLGAPGEFYRILVKEQRGRGSGVDQLMSEIRDAIAGIESRGLPEQSAMLRGRLECLYEAHLAGKSSLEVEILFDLALRLAAICYGLQYGVDVPALVETIIWHDPKFGVGVWYLELLREASENHKERKPDPTEVLLGMYVLSQWRPRERARSGDRANGE
jgi:MFS family permease